PLWAFPGDLLGPNVATAPVAGAAPSEPNAVKSDEIDKIIQSVADAFDVVWLGVEGGQFLKARYERHRHGRYGRSAQFSVSQPRRAVGGFLPVRAGNRCGWLDLAGE